jgi:flagellar basal-body rod protein FlgC
LQQITLQTNAQREQLKVALINGSRSRSPQPWIKFYRQMARIPRGGASVNGLKGVSVVGISSDQTPGEVIHDPGHPDADANGNVRQSNVNLSHEMVDLVTASRAYEANLKSLETFRQMTEQALSLLRGMR